MKNKKLRTVQILNAQGSDSNSPLLEDIIKGGDMKASKRASSIHGAKQFMPRRTGKGQRLTKEQQSLITARYDDLRAYDGLNAGHPIPKTDIDEVERVVAGKKDKLTLADYVYDIGANQKYWGDKVDAAAFDKIILSNPDYIGTGLLTYFNRLRNDIRRAEKIVLEDDFVRQVVRISSPEGKVDLKQIRTALGLARNPFSRTWMEWNPRTMLDERAKMGTLAGVADDAPIRMGAMCVSSLDDGSEYYVEEFTHDKKYNVVLPTMFTYGINTEEAIQTPKIRRDHTGSRISWNDLDYKTTLLLGYMGQPIDWEPLKQISIDINEQMYFGFFNTKDIPQWEKSIRANMLEDAGAIKFIITALALINSAKIQYNVVSIPSGRRLSGGKSIPYMEHRTVKIIVPAGKKDITKYLNSVLKFESARKRAHKVRGFWRVLDRGTPLERKTWVKTHVRGDASLGWVNQDHVVTT